MTQIARSSRLDVRLRKEQKLLIEQAARLLGQTVSAFTTAVALREAEQVIEKFGNLRLSNRDRDIFLAALDNPPEPNAKLRRAVKEYAEKVIS